MAHILVAGRLEERLGSSHATILGPSAPSHAGATCRRPGRQDAAAASFWEAKRVFYTKED